MRGEVGPPRDQSRGGADHTCTYADAYCRICVENITWESLVSRRMILGKF